MNQIETLEKLCALPGVTGFEQSAARTVAEMLRPLVNKVDIDPFGTVTGILVCPRPKAKTVLLDAHLDQIGFIVTEVLEGGFLRFMPVGGVDPRMLLGCEVTILTPTPLYGIVSCTPPHLMQPGDADKAVPIHEMLIDTGLLDAASRIPVGTPIVFRQPLVRLGKDAVSSKCLDDRAGVLAILQALKKIDRKKLGVHVAVMFSAQEEITSLGAMTGTFRLRPDYAIAVDVSHAKTPDAPSDETFAFGGGRDDRHGAEHEYRTDPVRSSAWRAPRKSTTKSKSWKATRAPMPGPCRLPLAARRRRFCPSRCATCTPPSKPCICLT